MEKKVLNSMQIAAIKRTAQNVAKFTKQKEKLVEKISHLQEELNNTQKMIDSWQEPIKTMTGGFTTEELVKRVVIKGQNKQGEDVTTTKYELMYPDTILPPTANTPAENTPTEETPVEETPTEEVPTEESKENEENKEHTNW